MMKPTLHQHEQNILAYYKDREKTQITGILPGKGVFVLFTNRCGSNYLVDLMHQLPTLTMKHEIFNSENIIKVSERRGFNTFEQYLRRVRQGCPTPHWGAKIGCVQLGMLHRFGLLEAFEQGSYIIWLKRKNIVAQAVSHYIAHHNKQWASFHQAKGEVPNYDFSAIELIVRSIQRHNSEAELALSLLGMHYHALWYEDYLADPAANMRRIASYIDEPFEEVELENSKFKKQSNPVKADYEARFRAEARSALML